MKVTGIVTDPYSGRPSAGPVGVFKTVAAEEHNGRVGFPYEGPGAYGERVTFDYQPPTREQASARAAAIRARRKARAK